MALSIAMQTDYGVSAVYHRIQSAQAYYAERCVDVMIFGYVGEEARHDGSTPLLTNQERLTFESLGTDEPTREAIYSALKLLLKFAGAEDC
ncbi:hypothetical protein GAY28_14560 [Azospirillum brasilense]|nr:hypothetical protein [Azospirillum brasilense]